ncbi:MAG: hypothetical protein HYY50_00280 [Candidatus Kerfeldbacteria bacterium]|nr:hypothetical protein [Candidatus Kerfeldbacteria bacterium]
MIEIVITIGVLGIISLIGINYASGARVRARNAQRAADAAEIQLALERYYTAHGTYPHTECISSASGGDLPSGWKQLEDILQPYLIGSIPDDPIVNKIIPGTPRYEGGPSSTWHRQHWHYLVSGELDNFQHYVIQIELEKSGSRAFLNSSKAIKGQLRRYRSPNGNTTETSHSFSSNSTYYGTCCNCAGGGFWPDDGPLVMCGDQYWPWTGTEMQYYCVGNVGKRPSGDHKCDGELEKAGLIASLGLTYESVSYESPPVCQ